MKLTVHDIESLRKGTLNTTVIGTVVIFGVGVAFTLGVWLLGSILAIPETTILVVVVFFVGGMVTSGALLYGLYLAHRHGRLFITRWNELIKAEIADILARLEQPEPEVEQIPAVSMHVKEPAKAGTFDLRDLEWLCAEFESGHKHTEDSLIGTKLHYTGETLTRARYNELMALLVNRGVVILRGGPGNKTGQLTVKTSLEMMALIQRTPSPIG